MDPILIFRHVEWEGPGYLASILDRHKIPYRLVCIDRGESVPADLNSISGLVFMGGPMSVNDPLPWIADELALIRAALEADMPVLGHCLGGQLISRAMGGVITENRVREIGWHRVRQIRCDASQRWLEVLPAGFEVFHWHSETFSIPKDASAILENDYCENQAFVLGKTLAMQCHVEMTGTLVKDWARLFHDQLLNPSVSVQSSAEILHNLEQKVTELQSVAEKIYERWLAGFG